MFSITLKDRKYNFDIENPYDISIPMKFDSSHPIGWEAPPASASTYVAKGFIGDTRRGGSCNVQEYRFIPHCHGTHTECIGHISDREIYVNNILKKAFIPSTLITVKPQSSVQVQECYFPNKEDGDYLIVRDSLIEQLKGVNSDFLEGLIIRTLPNFETKKCQDYSKESFPFFSLEAMEYLVELNIKHLLVDMPSVDRQRDGGYLSIHRLFWNVPLKQYDIEPTTASLKTISEMIYVPNWIKNGSYLLNLQIPAFMTDAAPSRPLLYQIHS